MSSIADQCSGQWTLDWGKQGKNERLATNSLRNASWTKYCKILKNTTKMKDKEHIVYIMSSGQNTANDIGKVNIVNTIKASNVLNYTDTSS